MIPRVVEAEYVQGYTIRLQFADGSTGNVDLGEELHGEVFEPLEDLMLFKRYQIHPEFQTLCWPNGANFAPEFLYAKVTVPTQAADFH